MIMFHETVRQCGMVYLLQEEPRALSVFIQNPPRLRLHVLKLRLVLEVGLKENLLLLLQVQRPKGDEQAGLGGRGHG